MESGEVYRVESVQSKTDIEPVATDNSVSFITLHTFSEIVKWQYYSNDYVDYVLE